MEHHSFMNYMGIELPGFVVPQATYTTPAAGFYPNPPIQFVVNGHLGIRLSDAEVHNCDGLAGATERPFLTNGGMKIGIRICWPGYETWAKHKSAYGHSAERLGITKARLAYEIARTVREFMTHMSGNQSTEARPDWWLTRFSLENIYLLELRHVSPGSWQPVFCTA